MIMTSLETMKRCLKSAINVHLCVNRKRGFFSPHRPVHIGHVALRQLGLRLGNNQDDVDIMDGIKDEGFLKDQGLTIVQADLANLNVFFTAWCSG